MEKANFRKIKFDEWGKLLSANQFFADEFSFIFRGQRNSEWKLETSLDRLLRKIAPKGINLDSTYDFLLEEFLHSIRGRTAIKKEIINHEELWALGQHHGLATPLLDWTRSLYVAIFFAFENSEPSPSGYRSIWALCICGYVKNQIAKFNKEKKEKDQFKIVDPISDENTRLITQSGILSRQPLNFSIEDWVENNLDQEATYLYKIDIAESQRLSILKHLRQMNIHHATLFPEISGAAEYCNQTLELYSDKHKKAIEGNF